MRPFDDPDHLTSEDRFHEIARVLAAGVLRLRDRADPAGHPGPKNPSESGHSCLELPGETVLSVHTG